MTLASIAAFLMLLALYTAINEVRRKAWEKCIFGVLCAMTFAGVLLYEVDIEYAYAFATYCFLCCTIVHGQKLV